MPVNLCSLFRLYCVSIFTPVLHSVILFAFMLRWNSAGEFYRRIAVSLGIYNYRAAKMTNKYSCFSISSLRFLALLLALSLTMIACSDGDNDDDDGGDQGDNTKFQPVEATVPVSPIVIQNVSTAETPCFDNLGTVQVAAYIFGDQETEVDDFDGMDPEPISVVSVVEQTPDSYYYQAEFSQPGKYRAAMTCEENLDDVMVDNDISFFGYLYIRVGEINDVAGVTVLPDGHWSTTTDCLECHTLGERYDVMNMNHGFVIGACIDCHNSAQL